ncbi:hypothetical protein AB0M48_21280 [Lentzea sp. NPDC051208]|uniref:hypothetical protein n=1 Tax=Lentzea sp. NPDC051208 TaxID=3154642 RepID=UPI003429B24F
MLHYLEPRTDVPAKDDWSTRLALLDVRIGVRHHLGSLVVAVTFVATFFLPSSPGNTAARIVLGVLVVMSLGALLPNRRIRRAVRRGLLDEPWRRVPAMVAEKQENDMADRLLLDGLVLKGSFAELPDVVSERQEVFVLGPDPEGRALIRAAGSTSMYVASTDEGEYRAAERVERPMVSPSEEPLLQDSVEMMRVLGHLFWVLPVVNFLVVGVLIALSVSPLAPAGLIAVAVLIPGLRSWPWSVEAFLQSRGNTRAVAGSEAWTPVPVRLLPWRRGHHVAGIADLPGGPALVRFPQPHSDLVANVAATGVMWVAGTHRGRLAVGLPGTGGLMTAVVFPDRAGRGSDPMSWWRRIRRNDYSDLPK